MALDIFVKEETKPLFKFLLEVVSSLEQLCVRPKTYLIGLKFGHFFVRYDITVSSNEDDHIKNGVYVFKSDTRGKTYVKYNFLQFNLKIVSDLLNVPEKTAIQQLGFLLNYYLAKQLVYEYKNCLYKLQNVKSDFIELTNTLELITANGYYEIPIQLSFVQYYPYIDHKYLDITHNTDVLSLFNIKNGELLDKQKLAVNENITLSEAIRYDFFIAKYIAKYLPPIYSTATVSYNGLYLVIADQGEYQTYFVPSAKHLPNLQNIQVVNVQNPDMEDQEPIGSTCLKIKEDIVCNDIAIIALDLKKELYTNMPIRKPHEYYEITSTGDVHLKNTESEPSRSTINTENIKHFKSYTLFTEKLYLRHYGFDLAHYQILNKIEFPFLGKLYDSKKQQNTHNLFIHYIEHNLEFSPERILKDVVDEAGFKVSFKPHIAIQNLKGGKLINTQITNDLYFKSTGYLVFESFPIPGKRKIENPDDLANAIEQILISRDPEESKELLDAIQNYIQKLNLPIPNELENVTTQNPNLQTLLDLVTDILKDLPHMENLKVTDILELIRNKLAEFQTVFIGEQQDKTMYFLTKQNKLGRNIMTIRMQLKDLKYRLDDFREFIFKVFK